MAIKDTLAGLIGIKEENPSLSISKMAANIERDMIMNPSRFKIIVGGPGPYVAEYTMPKDTTGFFDDIKDNFLNNFRDPKPFAENMDNEKLQAILLNCHTVNLPSRSFLTQDYTVHGPIRKIPYQETFEDLSTTFYLSESMKEREFFDSWLDLIGGGNSFHIEYYNNFISMMTLVVIGRDGTEHKAYNFYEIYPINISEVQFAYNNQQLSEFTVTWAYHHYEEDRNFVGFKATSDKSLWSYWKNGADTLIDSLPTVPSFGG